MTIIVEVTKSTGKYHSKFENLRNYYLEGRQDLILDLREREGNDIGFRCKEKENLSERMRNLELIA